MSFVNSTLEEIAARVKRARSAVILTHMRPDGDAIGSALALSCALDALGIEHCVCDESELPSNLAFLEGLEKIEKKPDPQAELYIAVDSSDGRFSSRSEKKRYDQHRSPRIQYPLRKI